MSISNRIKSLEDSLFTEPEIENIALARWLYRYVSTKHSEDEALEFCGVRYPNVPPALLTCPATTRLLKAEKQLEINYTERLRADAPTAERNVRELIMRLIRRDISVGDIINHAATHPCFANKVDFDRLRKEYEI